MRVLARIRALKTVPKPTGKWSTLQRAKRRRYGASVWKANPLRQIEKPDDAVAFKRLPAKVRDRLVDEAPVVAFNPRQLKTNQPVVYQADLEHFVRHAKDPEPVIVLKTKVGLYVHNGNHRSTVALLSGKKVRAKYIDLSKVKQIKAQTDVLPDENAPQESLDRSDLIGDMQKRIKQLKKYYGEQMKAAFNPDEPRNDKGEWSDGGGGDSTTDELSKKLHDWQETSDFEGEYAESAIRNGKPESNAIVMAIRKETVDAPFYRGLFVDENDPLMSLKKDDPLQIMPSSFSLDRKVANKFADGSQQGLKGQLGMRGVRIEVYPWGTAGRPHGIVVGDRGNPDFKSDKEVISGGKFTVYKVTDLKSLRVIKVYQNGVF